MIDLITIGKIIQKFRNDKKLTQEELAEKIDLSPHYLSKVERGLCKLNIEAFLKMASVLEFNIEDFGIKNDNYKDELKEKLINKILSSNEQTNQKYLNAITFVDEILKN